MQGVYVEDEVLLGKYAPINIVVFVGDSEIKVSSLEIESSCGDGDVFSFGNACACTVSMVADGVYPDLRGQNIFIKWYVRDTMTYELFYGCVTKAEISAGKTSIRAGDKMAVDGGKPMYISNRMRDHMTAGEGWLNVAAQLDCNYSQEDMDRLDPIGILNGFSSLPEEVSLSAVAGYLAGLVGCNAVIDRSGNLRLVGPSAGAPFVSTVPGYSGGSTAYDNVFVVSGISMERKDIVSIQAEDGSIIEEEQVNIYSAGDGTLLVENPLADQVTADLAWESLQDLTFRPGKYSFPQGIQIEPGDRIRVRTLEGYQETVAMSVSQKIDGGVRTTVSCGGWAESGGVAGQVNQALQTLTAEFARVRKLIAENAEIVNARINNLRAEDIVAGRIRSEDFSVTEVTPIYPMPNIYPFETIFCINGETIIKGFEIDFASQIIRGSFSSNVTDALDARITALEELVANLR